MSANTHKQKGFRLLGGEKVSKPSKLVKSSREKKPKEEVYQHPVLSAPVDNPKTKQLVLKADKPSKEKSLKEFQPHDWLSSKQLADYLDISETLATMRLRRAFQANFSELKGLGSSKKTSLSFRGLVERQERLDVNLALQIRDQNNELERELMQSDMVGDEGNKLPTMYGLPSVPPPGFEPSPSFEPPCHSMVGITRVNADNGWVVRCVARPNSGHSYQIRYDSLHQKKVEKKEKVIEIPGRVHDISQYVHYDWINVSQQHDPEMFNDVGGGFLYVLNANAVVDRCDQSTVISTANEDIEMVARKYLSHEGSFDSRCFVRCVNGRVDFMGNPARINRRDNVFGFDMQTSIILINQVLVDYGLPPFTAGQRFTKAHFQSKISDTQRYMKHWTGAHFTRLDVTSNISFGDFDSARAFILWLGTQKIGHQTVKVSPDANTVTYGQATSYIQQIAYIKATEVAAHSKRTPKELSKSKFVGKGRFPSVLNSNPSVISDDSVDSYVDLLERDLREHGVVRFELRVLRKFLSDSDYKYLGNYDSNFFSDLFMQRWAPAMRDFEKPAISELDPKVAGILARYLSGDDVQRGVSRATFYRYRKIIKDLGTGIDIARPYIAETHQLQSLKNVEVRPYRVPAFYVEGLDGQKVTGLRAA